MKQQMINYLLVVNFIIRLTWSKYIKAPFIALCSFVVVYSQLYGLLDFEWMQWHGGWDGHPL